MAVTITRAADRDHRLARRVSMRPASGDLVLLAISVAAVLAVGLTYAGRLAVLARNAPAGPTTVNLNAMTDTMGLEAVLGRVFESPADRRLAAQELFAFVVRSDGRRRELPNVGAISRAEVQIAAIAHEAHLDVYRQRAAAAQARAASDQSPPPVAIPLLAPADLSALKPDLIVRDRGAARDALLLWTTLYVAAFLAVSLVWRLRAIPGDRMLLAAAYLLTTVGFVTMLARQDLLRDQLLFVRYAQGVIVGLAAMTALSCLDLRKALFRDLSYVPLAGALLLCVMLILFGSGPGGSGARINLGPVQPVEGIRLLIALFLAGYFAQRWELLRLARATAVRGRALPSWVQAPSFDYLLPLLIGVFAALGLFFIQRDLGPALVVAVVFLVMYAVARGGVALSAGGFLVLLAGFYVGYRLQISSTLVERVRMWQSPWDNAARGGDQTAQALWAFASGGLAGAGTGLGDTRYIPAGHTDLVLASVGEELGIAGLVIVAIAFASLLWRALRVARHAATDYGFFLALALMLFLLVPVLLMLSGTLGLVPLTGVVTPFLSYGGSAMLANFIAIGLLIAIASSRHGSADLSCFRPAMRWLTASAAVIAVVLVAIVLDVQVLRADEVAVRPHLGLQADGSRRYQYNPRVLDIARQIPRGTIFDRRGLPLATEDESALQKAQADYARIGISIDRACPGTDQRCYPLGGRAFHLLGDARTRPRWSASNTSFIERDAEAKLRGFEDHQTAVRTEDASGTPSWTLRRDYSDLLPLLRHRQQPHHPDVRRVLGAPREVRLTIDAALQIKTAAVVASYARRSSGRAAAVVIDPATGDLLASVSYPWPHEEATDRSEPLEEAADDLFDRARYGLYPPGSTFKLIAAAAALQRNARARETTFVCSRLGDGRIGAKLPGWGRPVRDDVLDRQPHGAVDLHRAMVVSCNAYFAQLAVKLGPEALIETASRLDVSLAKGNAPARVRDALPQIGYGQGEVLATPLRMARVAASIAADGSVRDVRLDAGAPKASAATFVQRDAARLIGRYMRDVVLSGTARVLRDHPVPIAGKTGTAEVAGAPSHAWFVGYAPFGSATRRVAVAVLIENAGYGGAAAAPAAGEIVSAAASLGYARIK